MELGADINARNEDGANAIHFVAADGNLTRLKLLLQAGGQYNVSSKSGTPLHWAASKGHHEIIQLLLQQSPSMDINTISSHGSRNHE